MSDLISRETATHYLTKARLLGDSRPMKEIFAEIPSVEPERKVGHWIEHSNPNLGPCMRVSYECSCCHAWLGCEYFLRRSYCPNCGAKMEG